jgi:CRISPR/Cas system-associated exonuclease Cas4 (RecB family)
MASSDFIVSAKVKMREGDVGNNRPNSEAVNQKLSGSINGLIDSSFYEVEYEQKGYVTSSLLSRGAPIVIEKQSDVVSYNFFNR